MDIFDRNLAMGMFVAMFILAIAPALFPPRKSEHGLPETVGQLIAQYVYGTAALLIGHFVWLALVDRALSPVEVMTGLMVITTAGGAVVVCRYASMAAKRFLAAHVINRAKADRLEAGAAWKTC